MREVTESHVAPVATSAGEFPRTLSLTGLVAGSIPSVRGISGAPAARPRLKLGLLRPWLIRVIWLVGESPCEAGQAGCATRRKRRCAHLGVGEGRPGAVLLPRPRVAITA
jgi:hypothetical protein